MTSIDSGDIGIGAYSVVNEDGFGEACYMIRIINRSKDDVNISFDGETDHDRVRSDSSIQIEPPMMINKSNFSRYTKVYVRGTTSVGHIYVVGYFRNVQR